MFLSINRIFFYMNGFFVQPLDCLGRFPAIGIKPRQLFAILVVKARCLSMFTAKAIAIHHCTDWYMGWLYI